MVETECTEIPAYLCRILVFLNPIRIRLERPEIKVEEPSIYFPVFVRWLIKEDRGKATGSSIKRWPFLNADFGMRDLEHSGIA